MARVPELKPQELSEHQMRLAKQIGAARGGSLAVNGPWGLLLRNPLLCEKAAAVGTMLRDGTSVPKRLSELAIVMVARHWTAQFEWWAHARQGLKAGLSSDTLEAIRQRKTPVFDKADEAAAYTYINELLEQKKVGDETYRAVHDQIGTNGIIELTAIAGFYSLVAMLIVGLDVPLGEGIVPPLPQ